MTYKITEEDNITTIFLDGEIDMDKTEEVKEVSQPVEKVLAMARKFL